MYDRKTHAMSRAMLLVAREKAEGRLPYLHGAVACVDCGKPAQVYDHRDYNQPIKVDPVCQKCNLKRGPGAWNPDHPVNGRNYKGLFSRVQRAGVA